MTSITWKQWEEVFNDFEFFESKISKIFEIHRLGEIEEYELLTPGTNAVFRVNEYVVKIFVPLETRNWDDNDFEKELNIMKELEDSLINTVRLIAHGSLVETQQWDYIVMNYIDGIELGDVYFELSLEERDYVLSQLREFLKEYNIEAPLNRPVILRGLESGRWNTFERRLTNEIREYLSSKEYKYYRAHGDLTKDNIIYCKLASE